MLFDTEPDGSPGGARRGRVDESQAPFTELRRLLSALRDEESLEPAPRIADIERLVEQVRASGST